MKTIKKERERWIDEKKMEMRYKEIPKNLIENNENKENDVYARHDFDEFDKIFCM